MLKSLFKKKKAEEKELVYHKTTFTKQDLNTKQISISNVKKNTLIIETERETISPFDMIVEEKYLKTLCTELEELRVYCKEKGYEFHVSPLMNGFDKIKRRDVYIDPKREDRQVFDIDLYFNKKGRIDSFSLGTRKRFTAFAGEPPKIIEQTPLSEFRQAIDYLLERI